MTSAPFRVSLEESHAILRKVLPLMSERRVPAVPQNYTVWYDYVVGKNEALSLEPGRMLEDCAEFSPEVCQTVYERFYVDQLRAEVDGMHGALREAVHSLVDELGGLGDDIGHFTGVLDEAGVSLQADLGPQELKQLVIELAKETRRTRERSAEVENALHGVAEELAELRVKFDALSADSITDPLTGIANRRVFDESIRRLTAESASGGQELCLILADIDHFKAFNDTHGHLVGDQVLRFVAQEMDQCVKGRDVLCRYGGEEFAILLPSTPYEGTVMLAESIRAIIDAQVVPASAGKDVDDLTISMGVARYAPGEDISSFIGRADACLYQSNADGRNRVTGERDLRAN